MVNYVALLRGVNVGGKGLLPMSQLASALSSAGFTDVRTYIQSGNVLFSSSQADTKKLAARIKAIIKEQFRLIVEVVVFSQAKWRGVIDAAPKWWGNDKEWKHNLLIMVPPFDMDKVVEAIGVFKPEIEMIQAGDGVVYQSMSFKMFGRTTSGKLPLSPIYKRMTIRNYNTVMKIAALLDPKI